MAIMLLSWNRKVFGLDFKLTNTGTALGPSKNVVNA